MAFLEWNEGMTEAIPSHAKPSLAATSRATSCQDTAKVAQRCS